MSLQTPDVCPAAADVKSASQSEQEYEEDFGSDASSPHRSADRSSQEMTSPRSEKAAQSPRAGEIQPSYDACVWNRQQLSYFYPDLCQGYAEIGLVN